MAAAVVLLLLTTASLSYPGVGAGSQGLLAPPHQDSGLDTNYDRLHNYLQLDVRISVEVGGRFTVQVVLNDDLDLAPLTDASASVSLEPGTVFARVLLSGPDIYNGGVNGPYYAHITLRSDLGTILSTGIHTTAAYSFSDFQPYAIRIVPPTKEGTIDNDTDGLINWLSLTLSLDIATEDDYVVRSRLVDTGYTIALVWRTAVHLGPGRAEISQLFRGYPLRLANVSGSFLVTTDVYDGRGVLVDFLFYMTAAYATSSFEGPPVVLDPPHLDRGIDGDGNGLYEFLQVDVNLTVDEDTTVILRADLRSGDAALLLGHLELRPSLSKGARILALPFAGPPIYASGLDGPYQLRLTIQDLEGRLLSADVHATHPYSYTQFERVMIAFTPPHRDYGLDADGNGKYEALVLAVNATVNVPGTYRFQGVLGGGIADAYEELALGAGPQTVTLRFEGDKIRETGIDGPYRSTIDVSDAATGTLLDTELYRTGAYLASDFEAAAANRILGVVLEEVLDLEPLPDGWFNVLRVTVRLTVRDAGHYRLNGSLFAGAALVAASATTVFLSNGTSDVKLSFSGWEISASGLDGPYRLSLSLTDPMVPGRVLDAQEFTTGSFVARDFEAAAGAMLQGRVVSAATGLPLAGAEVWAVNYTNAFSRRTFTDGNGSFVLPLFAATHRLIVDHADGQAEAVWLSALGTTTATFRLDRPRWNSVQTDIVWLGWHDLALWMRYEFGNDGSALRARIDWEYGDRDGTVEPTEVDLFGAPPYEYGRWAIESGSTMDFLHVNGGSFLASSAEVYEDGLLGPALQEGVPFLQFGRGFSLNTTMPPEPSDVRVLLRLVSDTRAWSHRVYLHVPGSHFLASYETTGAVLVFSRWPPYIVDPEIDPDHPDASLPFDVNLVLYRRTAYAAPTPLPPGGLTANRVGSDVSIEWTPPTYNEDGSRIRNLAGYYVYRSTSSGAGYVRLTELPVRSNAFTDIGVAESFYYVVTAVNTDGIESRFSQELPIDISSPLAGGWEIEYRWPIGWPTHLSWILVVFEVSYASLSLINRVLRRRV